jgi:1-aminocyclopropane-1-carboxylate deaminase/D-cysteine desulfhydrase-like pyridoxal-dependent ACC family enzyme
MTIQTFKKWTHLFNPEITPLQAMGNYHGVDVWIKRDDLNHTTIQGNKLRKLKFNINYAIQNNYQCIATFGGAWSNHIVATAKAASLCGLKSVGFIRGDELENKPEKWSTSLIQAYESGMQLVFLNRQEYRQKLNGISVEKFIEDSPYSTYTIPEGGSNTLALQGVSEIIDELTQQIKEPSHIILACGTGGTLAGIIDGVADHNWQTKVIGISVLKGANYLTNEVKSLSMHHDKVNWQISHDYHAGGYAKINDLTEHFALDFSNKTGVILDKIYTSKAFYGAYDLIKLGEIQANSRIVIIHTGGLQGGAIKRDEPL